ncbi:diaminobutyrate--2-oxoglutarate transaminase family protein [Phytoactinopolyspora halotolerans]|uniref:Diaminobutyrate--2-oxoglutarate transaminase n=1 Tax=Phytoactinopolyspora halotolerans TaxID=1981512 RepID=A0A6L9SFE7_9ACTN|nr:diaminobutyrate--2-oxoglutarate transaminase family protein [Phytoactinopolyspora halotolerans]NEE03867.1 diaminobutyrate--2-oxoglutarate transaminase family protein [Phytoactinopolyspora halotolerans]
MTALEGLTLTDPHMPVPTADAPGQRPVVGQRDSSARAYHRRLPLTLVSARGATVRDADGREYIDCLAGAGALALGHHHPVVDQALREALDAGAPLSTLDLSTPYRDRFIDQLFSVLPAPLQDGRILFCGPSGADAVEAAIKLAKTATGRSGVLAFGGGYHGMTQGTLALTGRRSAKEPLGALLPEIHHLPFPTAYRTPLRAHGPASAPGGPGGQAVSGATTSAELAGSLVRWALCDDHSGIAAPAAVIAEPVQGEGGVHPMPPAFATTLRSTTTEAGAVLVADEVQTGLGRTGTLWASERIGFDPDILVLSKAVGGGLPLAVIVHRGELDAWQPGAHAGTFRGSTLALAAGAATIREVARAGLAQRAGELGRRLSDGLRAAVGDDPRVGDIRGPGLMVGVEVVDPETADGYGVPRPDGALAAAVQRTMLENGVIVEAGGPEDAVVRFLPPLIVSEEQIDRVVDTFATALSAARPHHDHRGSAA